MDNKQWLALKTKVEGLKSSLDVYQGKLELAQENLLQCCGTTDIEEAEQYLRSKTKKVKELEKERDFLLGELENEYSDYL